MPNSPNYYNKIISGFDYLFENTTVFSIDSRDNYYHPEMLSDMKRSSLNLFLSYYPNKRSYLYLINIRLSECHHPLLKSFISLILSSYKKKTICSDFYLKLKSLHNTLIDKDPNYSEKGNPDLNEILSILNIKIVESSPLSKFS